MSFFCGDYIDCQLLWSVEWMLFMYFEPLFDVSDDDLNSCNIEKINLPDYGYWSRFTQKFAVWRHPKLRTNSHKTDKPSYKRENRIVQIAVK